MKTSYKWTIIVLSLIVILISVGYAAYSTILNITGTAQINKSIWSVHYDKDSINVLTGTDSGYTLVEPKSIPTLNDDLTSLSFETELNINEETSFTVDVINDGTFTARVSNINLKIQSKDSESADYTTLANVGSNKWSNDYLEISVLWTSGMKNILDTVDIIPSSTKNMTIVVRYKQPEDYTLLPKENLDFKFDLSVQYSQVDSLSSNTNYIPKVATTISTPAEFITTLENNDENLILRLNNDIDLTNYELINIENNTTIEFNGNRITTAPNSIEVKNGGHLILEDTTGLGGITSDRGVVNVLDGGSLIINGGTYTTTNYTRGSGIFVEGNAFVTINDGIINAAYYSIGSSGNVDITINGGELNSSSTSKNGTWAYSVKLEEGKFTMNGGKITGVQGALALDGDVEGIINNGEIQVHESYDGANDGFYNMYITGTSSLKIYNGSFVNYGTRSVIYTTSSNDTEVYGGIYSAKGNTLYTGDNIKVTGGSFSHNIENYLVNGSLSLNPNTNLYEIES